MSDETREVVVIGAGIAGLACAHRLKRLGVDVVLLEKSDRVGGVMRTDRVGEFMIERGPNSSQGTEELLMLVEELGIIDDLVEGDPKAPAYVYFNKQLHAVPSGPGSFIKSNLLSARGKLRILLEPFVGVRRSGEEESVAAFARRRIGREAAERMVAPFVSGVYAGDPEALSVQAAFPRLTNLETGYGGLIRGAIAKAREAKRAKKAASAVLDKAAPTRRRLVSFREGMGFLPRTLAARLGEELITESTDCGLRITDSKEFAVDFSRAGSRTKITSKHVIVATPSRAASALVAPISKELGLLLDEIEYPPLSIVYLAYEKSAIKTRLDGFGFLVAPAEGLNILGCVWNSSLFDGRAPRGLALLTVFVGGARNPQAARLTDDELVSVAHSELRAALGIASEPRVVAITRYDRAIPQYNLGHAARVRKVESLLKDIPGLSLIGNYLHGVSTGDVIKEAERVAKEVAGSLSSV
ncbi:MAG TPA: protoporphyrinogen oxidase [Blastocatellia bacterium]|nr:protoporphyrinogen oxidase [Blastocatellia bacterium]